MKDLQLEVHYNNSILCMIKRVSVALVATELRLLSNFYVGRWGIYAVTVRPHSANTNHIAYIRLSPN